MTIRQRFLCYCTIVLAVFLPIAPDYARADVKVFENVCGGVHFRVEVKNNGFAFDNSYRLLAESSHTQPLFEGRDWFHAACLINHAGKALLVFQNYCSGSACNESSYGAVDPLSRKVLLKPEAGEQGNITAISALLGFPPPSLADYQDAFCCNDQTAQTQTANTSEIPVKQEIKTQPMAQKLISQPETLAPPSRKHLWQWGLTGLGVLIGAGLLLSYFRHSKDRKGKG